MSADPRFRPLAVLLLTAAFLACGDSPSAIDDDDDNGTGGDFEVPPFEPNPLSVTVSADAGRAESAVLDEAGGTLTVTAANGTVFTLSVPEGGLLAATEIRLTPLAAVDNLPLSGGLIGAVRIEPSGLRFADIVTLDIDPPAAVNRAAITAFGAEGNGGDFYLQPAFDGGGTAVLRVLHGGVHGVGDGTEADWEQQFTRIPASYESYVLQVLREMLTRGRSDKLPDLAIMRPSAPITAADIDVPPGMEEMLRELGAGYATRVLIPLFQAGVSSCNNFVKATQTALGWERMWQLLGHDEAPMTDAERATIDALSETGYVNCIEEAGSKCIDEHEIGYINVLLGFARQAALLGAEGPNSARALELALQCAHFEVRFESDIVFGEPSDVGFMPHVRATLPFLELPAGVPLEVLSFELGPETFIDCVYTGSPSSAHDFMLFSMPMSFYLPRDDAGMITGGTVLESVTMVMSPGGLTYPLHVTCDDGNGNVNEFDIDVGANYFAGYFILHEDEFLPEAFGFAVSFDSSELAIGELMARRTYNRSIVSDGVPVSEATTLELWHRP